MIAPKKHKEEEKRIKDLESYSILDTFPETDFDNLTMLAAEICGTPVSFVTFIDKDRQWFKSCFGISIDETSRDDAFCAHAINEPNDIFIIPDSRKDERFHDNPYVIGEPYLVFYAGIPLLSENGLPLGTLCVMDQKPRELTQSQISSLKALSDQTQKILELRLNKIKLEETMRKLEEKNQELGKFAYIAAHDLKSPLNNIAALTRIFMDNYKTSIDAEGQEILNLIKSSSDKLKNMIQSLLEYTKSDKVIGEDQVEINLQILQEELCNLFVFKNNCLITLESNLNSIKVNKAALDQIMINLVANAIKYNDKEITEIVIEVIDEKTFYKIIVSDNGPGISKKYHEKIFQIFEVLSAEDRFGESGNGIGLATVKKTIESLGGTIHVESEIGKGAKFVFTISKT